MLSGRCLLRGCAVIGSQGGNPTLARPGHAFTSVRQFMRKQLSETRRRGLQPVHDVEGTSRSFHSLVKPFIFATTVTATSFTAAAIWQYETFRRLARQNHWRNRDGFLPKSGNFGFYGKAGDFRRQLNAWWNQLYPAQKLVCGIIGVNVAVFFVWRVPQLSAMMCKYFVSSPVVSGPVCWPMLLSTFSHNNLFHLFINMYVLWSFAPPVSANFGEEHFIATYLSAGVVSGFASYAYRIARGSLTGSVGASGAIMALIGIVGTMYPDERLSIAFVNRIYPHSFSADAGVKGLIALDTVGLLLSWRWFDHAGHLGGMLFGIWYARYGHKLARKHRDAVVLFWHKLRGKP